MEVDDDLTAPLCIKEEIKDPVIDDDDMDDYDADDIPMVTDDKNDVTDDSNTVKEDIILDSADNTIPGEKIMYPTSTKRPRRSKAREAEQRIQQALTVNPLHGDNDEDEDNMSENSDDGKKDDDDADFDAGDQQEETDADENESEETLDDEEDDLLDEDESDDDELRGRKQPRCLNRRKRIYLPNDDDEDYEWLNVSEKDDRPEIIPFNPALGPGPINIDHLTAKTDPIEYFKLFLNDEIVGELVRIINKFVAERVKTGKIARDALKFAKNPATHADVYRYIGVLMNMGLIRLPKLQNYWAQDWVSTVPFFRESISRAEFNLYNNIVIEAFRTDNKTCLERLAMMMKKITSEFQSYYAPHQNLSINKIVIGAKGRALFKPYNFRRPTKYGLPVQILTDAKTGYLLNAVLVERGVGQEVNEWDDYACDELNRPTSAVLSMTNDYFGKGHHVFANNLYSSIELARLLYEKKVHFTGKIDINKKGVPDEIKERGNLKQGDIVAYRCGNNMIVKTKDNDVISLLSNYYTGDESVDTNLMGRRRGVFHHPKVLITYNENMHFCTKGDQYNKYHAGGRKSIFFWLLEMAITNSFILYGHKNEKLNIHPSDIEEMYQKFRRQLVASLVPKVKKIIFPRLENDSSALALQSNSECTRLNGLFHNITKMPSRGRQCVVCSDRKMNYRRETEYMCTTCPNHPALHPQECFQRYHTLLDYKVKYDAPCPKRQKNNKSQLAFESSPNLLDTMLINAIAMTSDGNLSTDNHQTEAAPSSSGDNSSTGGNTQLRISTDIFGQLAENSSDTLNSIRNIVDENLGNELKDNGENKEIASEIVTEGGNDVRIKSEPIELDKTVVNENFEELETHSHSTVTSDTSLEARPDRLDNEFQRLDGQFHCLQKVMRQYCIVCSHWKTSHYKQTEYACRTCVGNPVLHPEECFTRYHTLIDYTKSPDAAGDTDSNQQAMVSTAISSNSDNVMETKSRQPTESISSSGNKTSDTDSLRISKDIISRLAKKSGEKSNTLLDDRHDSLGEDERNKNAREIQARIDELVTSVRIKTEPVNVENDEVLNQSFTNIRPRCVNSSDLQSQRLNGRFHDMIKCPRLRSCVVCSNRKMGYRKETAYACSTCLDRPMLHPVECFARYHTLVDYKIRYDTPAKQTSKSLDQVLNESVFQDSVTVKTEPVDQMDISAINEGLHTEMNSGVFTEAKGEGSAAEMTPSSFAMFADVGVGTEPNKESTINEDFYSETAAESDVGVGPENEEMLPGSSCEDVSMVNEPRARSTLCDEDLLMEVEEASESSIDEEKVKTEDNVEIDKYIEKNHVSEEIDTTVKVEHIEGVDTETCFDNQNEKLRTGESIKMEPSDDYVLIGAQHENTMLKLDPDVAEFLRMDDPTGKCSDEVVLGNIVPNVGDDFEECEDLSTDEVENLLNVQQIELNIQPLDKVIRKKKLKVSDPAQDDGVSYKSLKYDKKGDLKVHFSSSKPHRKVRISTREHCSTRSTTEGVKHHLTKFPYMIKFCVVCRSKGIQKKTQFYCTGCKITTPLHSAECFYAYHKDLEKLKEIERVDRIFEEATEVDILTRCKQRKRRASSDASENAKRDDLKTINNTIPKKYNQSKASASLVVAVIDSRNEVASVDEQKRLRLREPRSKKCQNFNIPRVKASASVGVAQGGLDSAGINQTNNEHENVCLSVEKLPDNTFEIKTSPYKCFRFDKNQTKQVDRTSETNKQKTILINGVDTAISKSKTDDTRENNKKKTILINGVDTAIAKTKTSKIRESNKKETILINGVDTAISKKCRNIEEYTVVDGQDGSNSTSKNQTILINGFETEICKESEYLNLSVRGRRSIRTHVDYQHIIKKAVPRTQQDVVQKLDHSVSEVGSDSSAGHKNQLSVGCRQPKGVSMYKKLASHIGKQASQKQELEASVKTETCEPVGCSVQVKTEDSENL